MTYYIERLELRIASTIVALVSDIRFETGKAILICGANGSGKTLLLETIAGLREYSSVALIGVGSENIFYLPKYNILPLHFSVKTIVKYFDGFIDQSFLTYHCALLGLSVDIKLRNLSSGNIRKVNILYALSLLSKSIVLIDEVDVFLDEVSLAYIQSILESPAGKAVVAVSQHPNYWEKFEKVHIS